MERAHKGLLHLGAVEWHIAPVRAARVTVPPIVQREYDVMGSYTSKLWVIAIVCSTV